MRRSKRVSLRKRREPENLSDVAAWLYTDLLLGLAVIFIGGGAFRVFRTLNDTPSVKGSSVQMPSTHQLSCDEIRISIPRSISPGDLQNEVVNALDDAEMIHNWEDSKPGLVQIFGVNRNGDVAQKYADTFLRNVAAKTPYLKNSELIAYQDRSTDSDKVNLKIYAVYLGQVKDNGCKNN